MEIQISDEKNKYENEFDNLLNNLASKINCKINFNDGTSETKQGYLYAFNNRGIKFNFINGSSSDEEISFINNNYWIDSITNKNNEELFKRNVNDDENIRCAIFIEKQKAFFKEKENIINNGIKLLDNIICQENWKKYVYENYDIYNFKEVKAVETAIKGYKCGITFEYIIKFLIPAKIYHINYEQMDADTIASIKDNAEYFCMSIKKENNLHRQLKR